MAKTIPADEQVFMVSKSTNTTYSGSAALKAMNEWYTMADVANTVQPYKVFTALLTQSGDDNSNVFVSSGLLTIGVTYTIDEIISGNPDWTNVGAPNNEVGTKFIATGTTPNSWGEEAALYYSAAAPVATVLENTIGNVWFEYNGPGYYSYNSDGLFTLDKAVSINNFTRCINGGDGFYNLYIFQNNINTISIGTYNDSVEQVDDQLYQKMIEIRVYN